MLIFKEDFLMIVVLLLSIAFLTLFERKILSLSQIRLGPNKVSIYGIIQPILDGIKLLNKSTFFILNSHKFMYKFVSILIIFLSLISWLGIPYLCWSNKVLVFLFIIMMFGVLSYMILMLGWSSMSSYGLIGGNRSLAQTLSFEMIISLLIIITFVMKMKTSFKLSNINPHFLTLMLSSIYIMSIFLETHRAPLDLAEGESELVSGYNIEYGSIYFVLIFLSEYSHILFMSILYFIVWYKINTFLIVFIFLVMIVRSSFPRVRYDMIMTSLWMKFVPFLILMWFFFVNLKV